MEKIKLGDVASVITKGTTPTSIGYSFIEKGINFIKIESISEEGKFIKEKLAYISEDCHSKLKRSQLKENDILFSIAGAIGRVAVVDNDIIPANTNQALAIIRIDNRYDKEFLAFLLRSSYIKKQYNRKKQGVAQINLSLKDISELEIPVIDIKKQIEIKETLKKIIEIITLKKGQIEKLDNIVKSQFVEMFENEKYPKKTLNELTNKITDGSHNPPTGIAENEGYMMLSSQNIINNSINYENVRFLKKEDFEKENLRTNLNRGDVLLTIVGTVGRTAIITDETNITLQRSVAVLKPTKEINSIYLVGAINSDDVIRQLNKGAKGVAQKGIYLNDIKKILIAVPPIELQNQFAEIVKQIDKQKFEIESSLREMQELYEALMERYFG